MIEDTGNGGMVITGEHIDLYRLLALKAALQLEIRGMRWSRRRSIGLILKKEFGFKGTKPKLLDQLEAMIKERFPLKEAS